VSSSIEGVGAYRNKIRLPKASRLHELEHKQLPFACCFLSSLAQLEETPS